MAVKFFGKDSKKEANIKKIKLNSKDNSEQEQEESIFEKNAKELKDIMTPEYIDFADDYTYARVNNWYVKNMYIGFYPNAANFPLLYQPLLHGNIDTSIFISPIEIEQAKQELSKAKSNIEVELISETRSNNRQEDLLARKEDVKILREEVRDGINKIYDVSVISTLYAESKKELENNTIILKRTLAQGDTGLKNATYEQEKAFRSNKPLNLNQLGANNIMDKRGLGCGFPFTTGNINHENGIPIGYNMDDGQIIFFDTFDRGLDNYNMVIFAKSGGGKSTFIKMLSGRSSTLDDIQTISLDIEPEYNNIAATLGGSMVKIAPKSDTIINPFHIEIDMVEDKETNKYHEKILLTKKINSVTDILLTMAKGNLSSNNEYYDDVLKQIIKDCIRECYEDYSITEEVSSIYEYVDEQIINGKIVGGKKRKDMPTISSWYEKIKRHSSENKVETYQKYYDYLLLVMKDYCKSQNGGFTCFDGQNNVDINYDIPFINFDLSELNEKNELPLGQHIICDFIWETLVKRNNSGHKIRVIVDEAWRMAKIIDNKPVYPEALEFLDNMFRRARKKNTSTVVISQQFGEFYNDLTKSIIRNSDTKLFLPPDSTSIDSIQEVFKLTEGETEFLRNCTRGQGLLKCNTTSAKLYIDIPSFEKEFVETNQNASKERVNNERSVI